MSFPPTSGQFKANSAPLQSIWRSMDRRKQGQPILLSRDDCGQREDLNYGLAGS